MFIFSAALILISSYLIVSLLNKNNKDNLGVIYIFLIAFAQIVLSFEVLSLFKLIAQIPFLICNITFFIPILIIWILKKFPLYKPDIIGEMKKVRKALKRDKLLTFLFICFIVFLISEFTVARFHPIIFGDALSYYLPRATMWIQTGSLNHFITPDSRELIMPVNMDLLYTWFLMFIKSEYGIALFSYISFLFYIYVLYNFTGKLGFARRKRLWSVFVVSSFIIIAVMSYNPCADLFIGALLLNAVYLFYCYIKTQNKIPLYFSTLSAALAAGTKTTAVIAMPSFALILLFTVLIFNKKLLKKSFFLYLSLLFANFIIFSSYNYILNFIDFNNFVSCNEQLLLNKFRGGINGYLCNLIKYLFMFLDASAIKNIHFYHNFITMLQDKTLALLGEDVYSYTSIFFESVFKFDFHFTIAQCGLGIMGILAFIPSLIRAITKGIRKKASPKLKFISVLALSLIFNILLFSRVMVFTRFNFRYLVTFIVIASPVVIYSYIKSNKNIYKWIMAYFMFIYLFVVAHTKPASLFISYITNKMQRPEINNIDSYFSIYGEEPDIYEYFIKKDKSKIALMSNKQESAIYHIVKLRLNGYIVDRISVENIDDYNLLEYDYIIINRIIDSSFNLLGNHSKYCIYYDYERRLTMNLKEAAAASCELPENYFIDKGFKKVSDIQLKDFIIYER